MGFYSGQFGSALQRIDTSPITKGAAIQAQMFQNLGNTIASVANVYFKKKEEDKQIDALANNEAVLNHVYGGRVDAAGLPVMPSDPKEVRKDIRALYRRVGPAGIEAATRADQADARARDLLKVQQDTAKITKDKFDLLKSDHEHVVRQRDLKLDVLKAAYEGRTIKEKQEAPPSTIGQYFKKALGGAADLSKLEEVSGRLGHPLSEAAADEARRDPSAYLEGLRQPPIHGPMPSMRQPGVDPSLVDYGALSAAAGQQITPPETKPSYLGDMLGKAGEAIGGVEIPGTGTIRKTREVDAPIKAYSSEEFVREMMDVPGITSEHLPMIRAMAKEEGKPSMASSTLGISSFLLGRQKRDKKPYYTKAEAVADFRSSHHAAGRQVSEAAEKAFVDSAYYIELPKLKSEVMKDIKDEGLDQQYQRLDKLNEVREFAEKAMTNPQFNAPLTTGLARLFEPEGILTDSDIARFSGGDQSFKAEMLRLYSKKWTGVIPDDDIKNIKEVLDSMAKIAADELRPGVPRLADDISERYFMPVEDVFKYTPLGRYRDAIPEIGETQDAQTELRNAQPGDKIEDPQLGTIEVTLIDGQGAVHYIDSSGVRRKFIP